MTIKWPARNARVIPTAANCIVVTLTQGSKQVASSGPIARPTSGGTSTWTTPGLEPNTYTIAARAFPNSDGSGTVQANGSGSIAITATSVAQASVTMGSTVASVILPSTTLASRPGFSFNLSPRITNGSGAIVLVADSDISWTISDPTSLKLVAGGVNAQFQGVKPGSPTVSCTFNGVDNSLGQQPISTPAVKCVVTAPGPASSWPLRGGNMQGNATTSAPSLLSASIVWSNTYPQTSFPYISGIAPDGSVLFEDDAGSGANLVELNPDGTTKWTVPLVNASLGNQTLIAADGSIYLTGYQNISVLSGVDGSTIASCTLAGNGINCLLGSNGTLFWYSDGGTAISAIQPDGSTWSTTIGHIEGPPALDLNGNICVPIANTYPQPGLLVCVGPDGTIHWSTSLGLPFSGSYLASQVLCAPNGNLYVGMNTVPDENLNNVVAVSPSGSVLWTSQPIELFVVDSKSNLYSTPNGNASLIKVDAGTGKITTLAQFQNAGYGYVDSITQADILYAWVATGYFGRNTMYAYDTSGKQLWSVSLPAGTNSTGAQFPLIAPDGSFYTTGYASMIYKISGTTSRNAPKTRP